MGFSKEEKTRRILRGFKTVFFLITMVISFLVFSAPVFFVIADTLLPTALLSASIPPSSSSLLKTLYSHFSNYDFRYSLIDIPLISIIRSAVIISSFVFNSSKEGSAMEAALFICSLGFAIAHMIVAYRTSCRERRKLLVYKIDIEAISACKNGFPRYQKILQDERVK
uniref:MENTAL domain-containing protein n=1 Tax=Gossypium raimondii TaxID=29730 RepID=A0A0D2RU69_GOSRA|nr:hypothetical protein B456_011G286300 [Gossypium raimondii]